jgi:SulP family sulfate permease
MAIALLVFFKLNSRLKKIPGALVVITLGIITMLIVYATGGAVNNPQNITSVAGIKIVGKIPQGIFIKLFLTMLGIPMPTLTFLWKVDWKRFVEMILLVIPMAIVTFIIQLSNVKFFAQQNKYTISTNQELLALGFSNMFGSIFYSIVTTASLSRSMLNYNLGAKTPLSVCITACVVLLALFLLTPLFFFMPYTVLAATTIVGYFVTLTV